MLMYHIVQMFGGGKFWEIPVCLLSIFMSRDIAKIWTVKFGKPPVANLLNSPRFSSTKTLRYTVIESHGQKFETMQYLQ